MFTEIEDRRGASTPREQRRSKRLDELLESALDLFASHGPTLTVRQLAKEMGYTPGALYRYVKSKDELLARVQVRAHKAVHAALLETAAQVDFGADEAETALAKLFAAARFYVGLPTSLPREARLLAFLLGDPRPILGDEHIEAVMPSLRALLGDVAEMFRTAAACGALAEGNALERATCFWAALAGTLSMGKLARLDPTLFNHQRAALETASSLLLRWGATREAIDRVASTAGSHR